MLAFLAIAQEAYSARTTIITTVEEGDVNQWWPWPWSRPQQQRCQQQIQQQYQQLRHCQQYLSPGRHFETEIMMINQEQPQQQQHLQQCCQALWNVEQQCQCEAVKEAVRQLQQQQGSWEGQGQQMQQVIQKARYLPQQCNLGFQQCQIS
ncbi:hypothetical protein ACH5RR_014239 [Cinchona calisaya]|uniref:Bifunctional inhibitor/plant lipid transfer protein/seed storage helical domain-containing protein n=1 Tax=Cinchona calisaya TaxID=153742 RepID=A0ABD3A2C1_9GENT